MDHQFVRGDIDSDDFAGLDSAGLALADPLASKTAEKANRPVLECEPREGGMLRRQRDLAHEWQNT